MQLGAVADDFTGATDLGMMLRSRGLRTAVVIGDRRPADELLAGEDAIVVALKSRTAPAEDAVAMSTRALDRLAEWGAERFYFKYCSTFDSTDDGNIGPVLDAFRERLGVDRAVVVPAFPANGRTVQDGLLRVGADLLEDSPMRHHPLTPMTRSRLRDLLAPQTAAAVSEVGLDVVRSGVEALRAAVDGAPAGSVVVDAVTDDDLRRIADATAHHRLVSGAAGLALGFGDGSAPDDRVVPRPTARPLVVCGSASAATRAQVQDAVAAGHPVRKIAVATAIADSTREAEAAAAWVRSLPDDVVPVLYSVGEPSDVLPLDLAPEAARAVEEVIAAVVRQLVVDGTVDRVLVAGGETSGAVVQALDIDVLHIGPELAPGVCWAGATTGDGRTVALALKSGNFGRVDLFSTAWGVLA